MVRAEQNVRVVSLNARDHALLLSLLEHKVLSTHQIKSLYFRSFRRCQHRMKELRDLGLVSSFSVGRGFGEGRPPACWFLTKEGLAAIAEAKDIRASDLPWVPDHGYRTSQMLAHRLGVNAFFCALAEASRAHQGHCLVTWRPEHWVRTKAAKVKPDGFGRYLHPDGACEFYLEYDRGTEAFGALARKLEGYLQLAAGWTTEQELRVSESPPHRSGGGARGGGRLGASTRDRAPARPRLAGDLLPAVRCERGAALPARRARAGVATSTLRRRSPLAARPARPTPRPVPRRSLPRALLHRCRRTAQDLPRLNYAPVPCSSAPTCALRPRRGDAPTEAGLPHRRGRSGECSEDERGQQEDALDVSQERVGSEDDASLRALARALLALAEQLRREEAP
jgi:Replication-relaxation